MMRMVVFCTGLLAGLLLAGCRLATPHQPGYKQAVRTNAISNKHTLTESPTLERPAPRPVPGP